MRPASQLKRSACTTACFGAGMSSDCTFATIPKPAWTLTTRTATVPSAHSWTNDVAGSPATLACLMAVGAEQPWNRDWFAATRSANAVNVSDVVIPRMNRLPSGVPLPSMNGESRVSLWTRATPSQTLVAATQLRLATPGGSAREYGYTFDWKAPVDSGSELRAGVAVVAGVAGCVGDTAGENATVAPAVGPGPVVPPQPPARSAATQTAFANRFMWPAFPPVKARNRGTEGGIRTHTRLPSAV